VRRVGDEMRHQVVVLGVPPRCLLNVGWESTPQNSHDDGGWGGARNRSRDAPTPRVARSDSPDEIDVREWEEEQVKLDRDWYSGAEGGMLAGDGEHNPLAQYEDLDMLKQAEMAKKQVVRIFFRISVHQAEFVVQKKISA